MHEILIRKLHDYIGENNPDILIRLQSEGNVTSYLADKVASVDALLAELISTNTDPYFIEELCMYSMTEDLRPSRYNFIGEILAEEFPSVYQEYQHLGILRFELINMVESFSPVFDSLHFSEASSESRLLYYAICGSIQNYIERKKWN